MLPYFLLRNIFARDTFFSKKTLVLTESARDIRANKICYLRFVAFFEFALVCAFFAPMCARFALFVHMFAPVLAST